jgi:integrase
MTTQRITKSVVDRLKSRGTVWDDDCRGFGVRRQVRDASYVLKVRVHGRQRFLTIGKHGAPWTPETARIRARRLLADIAEGKDPAALRDAQRAVPNFKEFSDRYLNEHALPRKKPRSVEEDMRNLRLHIWPELAKRRITDITELDIARLHAKGKNRPANANRCLALLSHMFNVAEKWGERPRGTNPCAHIDKYPERARERMLSTEELARLGDALRLAAKGYPDGFKVMGRTINRSSPEDWRAIALIRLLIFSGARLLEVLTMRWTEINEARGIARLPNSKTGAKNVFLPAPALEVLSKLPRVDNNPYVLPGERDRQHFNSPQKAWQRIRSLARLDDVRIHDLRHAHASMAVANGESLYVVGKMLGHSQAVTTQRYAHLAIDPVLAAADRTAQRIAAAMNKQISVPIVPIRKRVNSS